MRSRLLAGLALLAILTGGWLAVPALAQNPTNKPAAAISTNSSNKKATPWSNTSRRPWPETPSLPMSR